MPRLRTRPLVALFPLICALGCGQSPAVDEPPAPPTGLQAAAADGAVTLSWEARDGAIGYRVYSGLQSAGALTKTSTAADAGTQIFLRVEGLTNGAPMRFAVTARGRGGESALSDEVVATPVTNAPLAVVSISPADGSLAIARNAPFIIKLNKAVDPLTAVGTPPGSACTGALQLSADGFATCLRLAAPAFSDGNGTITVRSLGPLPGATTVKLRVTSTLKDSNGLGLGTPAAQANGITTKAALAVTSTDPAAGATGVSRLSTLHLSINRAVTPASATATADCAGAILLSTDPNFAAGTCLAMTVSVTAQALVATPAAPLPGQTALSLRVSPALTDDDGVSLDTPFTLATPFTTLPVLTVAQSAPTGSDVPRNTSVSVTFSQAVQPGTVTASLSGSACSGSLQLSKDSFATCVPMRAQPASSDGDTTFTVRPTSDLEASTPWQVRVTTAVLDVTGAPLAAAVTRPAFTTGTAVDLTPPGPVTGAAASARLQAVRLTWTNPTDADFASVRVYTRLAGATPWTLALETSDAAALVTGLLPGATNDFKLTTLDTAQNESAGVEVSAVTGALSGLAEDFTDAQTVAMHTDSAAAGPRLAFTWSDTTFYAAVSPATAGTSVLTGQNQLWIGVDTDPDTDATGEVASTVSGSNALLWPFKADLVIQLAPGSGTPHVFVHTAGGGATDTPAGSQGKSGALEEVAFTKALIGNPAKARFSFALVDAGTGYVFALWPSAAAATDVFGYSSATTASHAPGANLWVRTAGLTSVASGVVTPAAALVKLAVHRSGLPSGSALFVGGNQRPLSFADAAASAIYTLRDDGTQGDDTAGDQIYTGRFNFGGYAGELLFKFRERTSASVSDEPAFAIGKDRVWTLGGGAESAPVVEWGQAWSATHAFSLTFRTVSAGRPSEIRGNQPELGTWGASAGPAPLATSQCASGTACWDTTVAFPAPASGTRDLLATPLEFKAWYADHYEDGAGNHSMNDDVLNTRLLRWDAGLGPVAF